MSPTRPASASPALPPFRRPSLACLILFVAGIVLAACGADPSKARAPHFERLSLHATGGQRPDATPRLIQHMVMPAEITAEDKTWRIKAKTIKAMRVEKLGELRDQDILRLQSDTQMRLGTAELPEVGTYNQLALTLVANSETDVSVMARERGNKQPLFKTDRLRVPPGRNPRTVIIDLPGLRGGQEQLAELTVLLKPRRTSVSIVSIDLLHRPWATWLPDPDDAQQLVNIGRDSRRSVGLSSERGAGASFVARAGGRLSFSYGVPPELQTKAGVPRLIVKLGEQQVASLDLRDAAGTGWRDHSIATGAEPGATVELAFSLEGAGEALCALGEVIHFVPDEKARTVVLVTSDTHRADYLGHAGRGIDIQTPFLDELAAGGVRFEHAVSASNITNPSHVSIMTGVHPRDTGVVNNYTLLSDAAPTLAEAFADAGYRTYAAVTAQHLGPDHSGLGQGFDRVSKCEGTLRDSEEAIADLDGWAAAADGSPLFIWLHIFDAHAPYKVDAKWRGLYYPKTDDPAAAEHPDPIADQIPKWGGNVRDPSYFEAMYRSEITYLDAQLRGFLEQPRYKDAVIAITSDHGESLTEHGIFWDHRELYPSTLDVPLILNFPGSPKGTLLHQKVQLTDLARTLLDIAGLAGSEFPGKNLLGIQPESPDSEKARYFIAASGLSAAVLEDRWFLVLHLKEHNFSPLHESRARYEVELYDLRGDRRCENNLVAAEHQTAKRLRAQLIDWLESGRSEDWALRSGHVQSAAAADALKELGYTNADDSEESSTTPKGHKWFDPSYTSDWITRYE